MKLTLRTRVSLFIALLVILLGTLSTLLFTVAHRRSAEREIVARGMALAQTLARAAARGLVAEDLDLLQKASYVVQAPDVRSLQIFSSIWEPVDAYPFGDLKLPPDPRAVRHFETTSAPLALRIDTRYEFLCPIEFTEAGSPGITIGYARLALSTVGLKQAIRRVVLENVLVSALLTLLAIVAVNAVVGRMILQPLAHLHRSVALFKNGHVTPAFEAPAADEVAGISREFQRMSELVADRERRLTVSERRLRDLFERIEHAVFRLDAAGAVIEANEPFRRLCGDAASFAGLAPGGAAGKGGDRYLETARAGGIVNVEETITGAGGASLVVLLSLYPSRDEDGEFAGFDGYFIDITERTEMTDALRVAYRDLERSNRELRKLDEMKDALIRDVTHEFKTPVAKHAMQLELLRAQLGDGCLGKVGQTLEVMERSVRRQQQVVRNLLDLARLESGWHHQALGPVRLDEALCDLAQEERPLLERAGVELRVAASATTVIGHAELLWHVFSNLLNNAVKYRRAGARSVIDIEVAHEEGWAEVRLRDTGIGLTPEQRARVFERFYQASPSSEGAGVGLSICARAVEGMGGTIGLESAGLGQGTTAVVRLPLAAEGEPGAGAGGPGTMG
jgi:signal transduction histidine kinase